MRPTAMNDHLTQPIAAVDGADPGCAQSDDAGIHTYLAAWYLQEANMVATKQSICDNRKPRCSRASSQVASRRVLATADPDSFQGSLTWAYCTIRITPFPALFWGVAVIPSS